MAKEQSPSRTAIRNKKESIEDAMRRGWQDKQRYDSLIKEIECFSLRLLILRWNVIRGIKTPEEVKERLKKYKKKTDEAYRKAKKYEKRYSGNGFLSPEVPIKEFRMQQSRLEIDLYKEYGRLRELDDVSLGEYD